ncbi:MAG: hypothetical protein EOP04_02265 [Proteobacteria bacterium]|nr:MAG: hypothetical protein EOP04_02265 [Pseudomonadota bacterium]
MAERIFSVKTVELFKECILTAEDRDAFPLREYLKECCSCSLGIDLSDSRTARFQMDGILKIIDWTNLDEIEPILPIALDAYAESPIHPLSFHKHLDAALAQDGYQILEGQILRLAM